MNERSDYNAFIERLKKSDDEFRAESTQKRHANNFRTARENLNHLVDQDTFLEFGQFAVAAQRSRRDSDELILDTNADGIITGFCNINSDIHSKDLTNAVAIIYDYSVLAGTQGFFHHQKLDRICDKAKEYNLPIVIFTEGGGGRPGDVDVLTQIAGLHVPSFANWASLRGTCLRIAITNGYCFAGNAALYGSSDIRIATKGSNIGMAGPAMIEGGGLGKFSPKDVGPVEDQLKNGVVDILVDNEEAATQTAKSLLSYFQGSLLEFDVNDQSKLKSILPDDRRYTYEIRDLIEILFDKLSFIELKRSYGQSIVTGFARIEGKTFGVLASDCKFLGGAIDSEAADKAAQFFDLCNDHGINMISLVDTPGFMVGPDSEEEGAVRRMSKLFESSSRFENSLIAIFIRKAYGLGAQAIVGGSLHRPTFSCAWPSGEFGGMGIEGAVKLGYRKELEAIDDVEERNNLFNKLVQKMYEAGQAIQAATFLEIDAVIDPAQSRETILKAIK